MGQEQQIQRRLAAHAVTREGPEGPEDPAQEQGEDGSEAATSHEPVLKTVADVLRYTASPSAVVLGLKRIGVVVEESDTLVYKLRDKLAAPAPGVANDPPFLPQIRFSTQLTGYHIRRMRSEGEGTDNAVAMSRVEALTGQSSSVTDRLSYIDSYAVMAIAAAIVSDAGNV